MLATAYNFWAEWEAAEKVSFDGVNKLIYVYPHVIALDARADLWSAAVRWLAILNRGNDRFLEPMDRTGLDPIPGGETGDSYFLINGWRLIIDFSKVKMTGVLYSKDFDSAYFTSALNIQYAAEVSSVVNIVTIDNTVINDTDAPVWDSSVGILTAQQVGSYINISWSSATDASGAVYNVYISQSLAAINTNAAKLGTYSSNSLTIATEGDGVTQLTANNYYIAVKATDPAGNETSNTNYMIVNYTTAITLTATLIADEVMSRGVATTADTIAASQF